MTSLAFILGVVPLAMATGAGAEMRQSLGTAVLFGMLGVTLFGLLFTPTFYAVVHWLSTRLPRVGRHTAGSRVAMSISEGMRDDR
jgi:Cu/Ag efflux pump CusA